MDDRKIPITKTPGGFQFLALESLIRKNGRGGTDALQWSLGLTGFILGRSRKVALLSSSAEKALRKSDKDLLRNTENIELKELTGIADIARCSMEQVMTARQIS